MPDEMNIGWFSPIPPARSEIAAHTERLRPTLEEHTHITYWADGLPHTESPHFGRSIVACGMGELNSADVNIYNMGNHAPAHARIFKMKSARPGVVVLHDTYLRHFFAGLYLHERNDPAGFVDFMAGLYGQEGRRAAEHFLTSHGEHINGQMDCVEACIEHSLATVVHSETARDSLRRRGLEPFLLPLPFPVSAEPPTRPFARHTTRAVRVVMCGYMGFNRRILEVLKAFRECSQRSHFRLEIYGIIPDQLEIPERIAEYGLQDIIRIRGYVDAPTLEQALNEADLAINLRYPTMGEASASQLRFWERAIPTIASRTGWYAEQPPNTLEFVRPGHEVEDLAPILSDFLADPESFARLGMRGREHVARFHRPEDYVAGIISAAGKSIHLEPARPALEAADRIGRICAEWAPESVAVPALKSAARGVKRIIDGV